MINTNAVRTPEMMTGIAIGNSTLKSFLQARHTECIRRFFQSTDRFRKAQYTCFEKWAVTHKLPMLLERERCQYQQKESIIPIMPMMELFVEYL